MGYTLEREKSYSSWWKVIEQNIRSREGLWTRLHKLARPILGLKPGKAKTGKTHTASLGVTKEHD